MQHLDAIWDRNKRQSDHELIPTLIETSNLSIRARADICARAAGYVEALRAEARPSLMEAFLAEYG